MADIIIDGTIGANRLLLLDSTGKIPAVDGSQVTTIAAGNIATGTIPIARIDTGTTANKIVKLDGNAKLPAVDGSLITNVPGATKNSSDPTASTNPSGGVGTEWHNTTSGEAYICTDATAGANVWTNVGEGVGNIAPFLAAGTLNGYFAGSFGIDKVSFASSTANASDHGDLTTARNRAAGASSTTHGYTMAGYNGSANVNIIDKFAFGNSANATDVGDVTVARRNQQGAGSYTHGYCVGGRNSGLNTTIDKVTYSTNGNATDVGDLTNATEHGIGSSSETHGYLAGGHNNAPGPTTVRKFAFASDGNATNAGSLAQIAWGGGGHNTTTHGFYSGGQTQSGTSGSTAYIHKYAYASDGTSTQHGDLVAIQSTTAGNSSTTYGYIGGQESGYSGTVAGNHIQRFSFSNGSTKNDVGDLTTSTNTGMAVNGLNR